MTEDELVGLDGIGPIIAAAIRHFFEQPRNLEVIDKLKAAGVDPVEAPKKKGGPLEGQTFVLTGRLEAYSRDEAAAAIEERGDKVTSSVSKKMSYVVVGESPGFKLAKAESAGVPILDEAAFVKLLGAA
jgi:DNA ligase (NAD+)